MINIKQPVSMDAYKQQAKDLKVFTNHLYEYKKGVRNLILTTEQRKYEKPIRSRLEKEKIDYAIQDVNQNTINVFFGAKQCIDVVKTFVHKKLNEMTPEQDFILGSLLGYDPLKQCSRYLEFVKKKALKKVVNN